MGEYLTKDDWWELIKIFLVIIAGYFIIKVLLVCGEII